MGWASIRLGSATRSVSWRRGLLLIRIAACVSVLLLIGISSLLVLLVVGVVWLIGVSLAS